MAHASDLEKAQIKMKKIRKQKKDKRTAFNQKTQEEQDEYFRNRYGTSLKDKILTAVWDFEHHQYPRIKYKYLLETLNQYPEVITDEGLVTKIKRVISEVEQCLREKNL